VTKLRIGRRTLLRGVVGGAAVSLGLPLLDVFMNDHGDALADGSGFPTRFGLFYWGNGNLPARWRPSAEGAWASRPGPDDPMRTSDGVLLSPQLAPLADIASRITVVTGMDVKVRNQIPHFSGVTGILAGTAAVGDNEAADPTLPTIDQLLAAEIGGETLFPYLAVGVLPETRGKSYLGLNGSVTIEASPSAIFQQLFGPTFTAPGDTPVIDPAWRLRRSVLDGVLDDASKLRGRLGANDRLRLDGHMEQVRALERRLTRLETDPPTYASCARPDEPAASYPSDPSAYRAISEAHANVLAMAFACDFTRVASMWWSDPVRRALYAGIDVEHHDATHNEADPQPMVDAIVTQIMEQYAYLVRAFDAVQEGPDPTTTLLDHAVVLGTSDVSLGKTHSLEDMPIVYAGSAGDRLLTGVHHRSSRENASKLMLSLIRAVGVDAPSFGSGDGEATQGLGDIEQ
jgi:hypothetical protein